MPVLLGLAQVDACLAGFLFQHFAAKAHRRRAFLGTQVLLDTAARLGGLDDLEPVPARAAVLVGDDFHRVAALERGIQRNQLAVDLRAHRLPTCVWMRKAKSSGVAPSGSSFTSPAGVKT